MEIDGYMWFGYETQPSPTQPSPAQPSPGKQRDGACNQQRLSRESINRHISKFELNQTHPHPKKTKNKNMSLSVKRGKGKDEEDNMGPPPKKAFKKTSDDVEEEKTSEEEEEDGSIFICEVSKNRKVSVRNWQGKVYVDIREFYLKDGKKMPGKKGISLSMDQWKELRAHVDEIDKALA